MDVIDAELVRLGVERCRERVLEELGAGQRVLVRGAAGSGRGALARALHEHDGAVVVQPPELREFDAVLHALLQASRAAGVSVDNHVSVAAHAAQVAERLADLGRLVVLRLPATWGLGQPIRHDHDERRLTGAREFIEALLAQPDLRVVIIADRPRGLPRLDRVVSLDRGEARPEMLSENELWAGYAGAARSLLEALSGRWPEPSPSPVALRLAVGLVALGESPAEAAERLRRSAMPGDLVGALVARAVAAGLVELLERLGRVRFAVPRAWIAEVVAPGEAHLPLFTACLAYGDEQTVKMSSATRVMLRAQLESSMYERRVDLVSLESTHEALADRYEQVDGVLDPSDASEETIVAWLEKVHHLARGGETCAARWGQQRIEHRDLLCDRARVLSRDQRDYLGAAALYQRVLDEIDPLDGYAAHYLGFNLDRAAVDRERAERAFRRAVELEGTNPWWNGRYVSFLIHQGRVRDADRAWQEALSRIDPDGDATDHEPDLARHLHLHVARTWLEHGEVGRARSVVECVVGATRDEVPIRALRDRVADAEEALSLGASVRPPGMPPEARWRPAVLLEQDESGRALSRWFAGRVAGVDRQGHVELVFATTEPEPERRRLLRKTIDFATWGQMSRVRPEQAAGRFVEVGEYGARVVVELVPALAFPRWGLPDTRYLTRWAEE